jgi:beta-fructofuranosidase
MGLDVDRCINNAGANVSCGPASSQRCQREPIWPRPVFHVMDLYCAENDPNGPYVDPATGVFHLFYQDHVGLPSRNASLPGAGLSWGHAASPDLAHWVHLPIGLWGGELVSDRDCGGLSTGSATVVGGVPHLVYPGGCRPGDPNAVGVPGGVGAGSAYSAAVPADRSDKLARRWRRIGPLINDTDNDPSEAWRTPHGEWRLVGHGGGGKCAAGGPLSGSDCAPMWATADPGFTTGWYKVGTSALPAGECQNGPYRLPALYPGTSVPAGESLPTHVHHTGGLYLMGTFVDGSPGVGDGHTGSFTPTAGVPFVQFVEDHGAYYASKGFTDTSTNATRRIIYGWNRSPPASQTLPRVVTYHPGIKRLLFSPAPELRLLRQRALATIPDNSALEPNVTTAINGTTWAPGEGSVAEVRVRWRRPVGAARLSLTVMIGPSGGGSHTIGMDYTPPAAGATGPWNIII